MQWVDIRIRGVGVVGVNNPVVVANDIVDARGHFPSDDRLSAIHPNDKGAALATLDTAAREIEQKLNALRAAPHAPAVVIVRVQCAQGESRSARCVGAYLIRTLGFTSTQALQFLQTCYNSPRVDACPHSNLSKGNVDQWLFEYENQ